MSIIIPVPIKDATNDQLLKYEVLLKEKLEFYKNKPSMPIKAKRNVLDCIMKELKEIDFQLIRRGQRINLTFGAQPTFIEPECKHIPKQRGVLICQYCGKSLRSAVTKHGTLKFYAVTNHSDLTGLLDDDVPQYVMPKKTDVQIKGER